MEKYLLSVFGSSVDYFYESDTYPEEGDYSHARPLGISAGGCPLNVGAVCAAKGRRVIALDMLGKDDDTTDFLLSEMKRLHYETDNVQIKEGVSNGKVLIILTGEKRTMFVINPVRPPYKVDEKMRMNYGYSDENIYGIDQFIGETDYWGQGIGTLLVKSMTAFLLHKKGAKKVIMDPEARNERAIRCYEKCGFKKVKELHAHELHEGIYQDCWLMEYP